MMNDIVSDFLTRIRNASLARKERVETRYSKIVENIAEIFKSTGFVADITKEGGMLIVMLNPDYPVSHVKRLSKPGLRRYVKTTEIPRPQSGLGMVIVSTPKGILTGSQARKQRVGGELICEVW